MCFSHQRTGLQLPDSSAAAHEGNCTARLTFANGATCDARLVLGCDGLRSPVCEVCMSGAASPDFQGMVTLHGRIATHALQQLPSWRDVISRQYMVGAGHHAMVYSATDDITMWVITVPYSTIQGSVPHCCATGPMGLRYFLKTWHCCAVLCRTHGTGGRTKLSNPGPPLPPPPVDAQERGVAYQPYGATPKPTIGSCNREGGTAAVTTVTQGASEYDAQGALAEATKLADIFAPSLLQVCSRAWGD